MQGLAASPPGVDVGMAGKPSLSSGMQREATIAVLRRHEGELRAAGIAALSLFGSAARDEAGPSSDLDIAVVLHPDLDRRRGLAWFGAIEALRDRLQVMLGRPVDLVPEPARKPALRQAIERDRIRAF